MKQTGNRLTAGGVAGAITTLLFWAVKPVIPEAWLPIPEPVIISASVIIQLLVQIGYSKWGPQPSGEGQ